MTTDLEYDGVQHDTFNDGPPACACGRAADYDGRRCCACAPLTADERTATAPGGDFPCCAPPTVPHPNFARESGRTVPHPNFAAIDREVVAHGGDASDCELPDCRVCGGAMEARNWPGGIGEVCTQCGAWHYL